MSTIMLINAIEKEELRIAIVRNGVLEEFYIETATTEERVGNIYLGIVEHVEPSLQACFVNFGAEKNGFLSISEIHPEYYSVKYMPTGEQRGFPPIDKVIRKVSLYLCRLRKRCQDIRGLS